tara:strand:+ start:159 stop:542 length:384 start_codon:yes stop_codon:yes gene_type:complete
VKNENIKLMIATMIVDGQLYTGEARVIKFTREIFVVDVKLYNELMKEAKEIIACGYDESKHYNAVLNWSQPALDTLLTYDPAIKTVTIANMVLVAYADKKIQDIEIDFIEYCALFLDVPVPKLRKEQ